MAKPTDTVPSWGTAGNYGASVYPLNYPWNAPNPSGGNPTPWSGLPRINAAGLVAFANTGLTPQIPSDASSFNAWLNYVGQWSNWVEAGSDAADADAHIVETNGAGTMFALLAEFTNGAQGAGGGALPLPEGAYVPTTKTFSLLGTASIWGTTASSVNAGTLDTIDVNGVTNTGELSFYSDATTSPTAGVLQWDGRSLTVGDGSLATGRRVPAPYDSYIAGPISTVNGIADTGASITITLAAGESVIVEMKSEMENTDVTPAINFRIENNAVTIGSNESRRAAASSVYTDCNRSVKYTAVGAELAIFKARFGAIAGTTNAKNVLLTVRRAN